MWLDAALQQNRERLRVVSEYLQDPVQSVPAMRTGRELVRVRAQLVKERDALERNLMRLRDQARARGTRLSNGRVVPAAFAVSRRQALLDERRQLSAEIAQLRTRERQLERKQAAYQNAPRLILAPLPPESVHHCHPRRWARVPTSIACTRS
jgi:hypothetical protein